MLLISALVLKTVVESTLKLQAAKPIVKSQSRSSKGGVLLSKRIKWPPQGHVRWDKDDVGLLTAISQVESDMQVLAKSNHLRLSTPSVWSTIASAWTSRCSFESRQIKFLGQSSTSKRDDHEANICIPKLQELRRTSKKPGKALNWLGPPAWLFRIRLVPLFFPPTRPGSDAKTGASCSGF